MALLYTAPPDLMPVVLNGSAQFSVLGLEGDRFTLASGTGVRVDRAVGAGSWGLAGSSAGSLALTAHGDQRGRRELQRPAAPSGSGMQCFLPCRVAVAPW